jgi:hypothetical protein
MERGMGNFYIIQPSIPAIEKSNIFFLRENMAIIPII